MLPAGFKIVDDNMGIFRLCFYWSEQKNNKLNKLKLNFNCFEYAVEIQ